MLSSMLVGMFAFGLVAMGCGETTIDEEGKEAYLEACASSAPPQLSEDEIERGCDAGLAALEDCVADSDETDQDALLTGCKPEADAAAQAEITG